VTGGEEAHAPAGDEAAEPAGAAAARPSVRAILSRLRIQGFKSFADAATVEVMPGLTGIVGPNGCGKSNVVEALRWAMGETSARSMRGGEMDDVIFAGTATRPGRNLAEVTLVLEEAAGLAPPPHDTAPELEISRRIARGEGSAFRVNGRELRARDVQTMFMDIGSGARASGMVSQGRVAALIGAKPEERRGVLEEAAGTAGLRARKHEAELKLRQAEQNLLRAEDLLGQLDAQRQGLQRQARQANRYRNLSGLVRGAEAEWLAILAARAAAALDVAEAAHDKARSYVADRQAFGGSLIDEPTIRFTLADMATALQASRTLLWRAASALDENHPEKVELCAMAKRYVTDACFDVADQALQLHGGYGYLREYGLEKIVRDLRVHRILEGTNEIMRVVIGRAEAARARASA